MVVREVFFSKAEEQVVLGPPVGKKKEGSINWYCIGCFAGSSMGAGANPDTGKRDE